MHIRKDAIPDNQFEFSPDSDTELSNYENESEQILFQLKNYTRHRIKLGLSIPNIFFFSKSVYQNISKSYFKRLYTLVKVFYSSSFFGGIRFLIRSPTKNPLTFGRTCQMVIFAPNYKMLVTVLAILATNIHYLFTLASGINKSSPFLSHQHHKSSASTNRHQL